MKYLRVHLQKDMSRLVDLNLSPLDHMIVKSTCTLIEVHFVLVWSFGCSQDVDPTKDIGFFFLSSECDYADSDCLAEQITVYN